MTTAVDTARKALGLTKRYVVHEPIWHIYYVEAIDEHDARERVKMLGLSEADEYEAVVGLNVEVEEDE